MDIKKLLGIRAAKKAVKPLFIRQSAGSNQSLSQKVRVGTKYRKPKGYHSKMRKGHRGTRAGEWLMPSCGYRAPAAIRGTNSEGRNEVVVASVSGLEKVNAKTDCVIVSATAGRKNKIAILEKAMELKLTTDVDAKAVVTDLKKAFEEEKAAKAAKKSSRAKAAPAKDTKKKATAKKEKSAESKEADDDKSSAKKEQEKILINKDKAM